MIRSTCIASQPTSQSQHAAVVMRGRRNYWGELAIFSSRRLGELIREGQAEGRIAKRGGDAKAKSHDAGLKLSDIGIDKHASARAQRLASIPAEKIDEYTRQNDFTPSEAVAMGKAIEERYRLANKQKMAAAAERGRKTQAENLKCEKPAGESFPSPIRDDSKRTREQVASAIGMSGRQYEKANVVRQPTHHPGAQAKPPEPLKRPRASHTNKPPLWWICGFVARGLRHGSSVRDIFATGNP